MHTTVATDKYLTFRLMSEDYAVNVMQVVEIIRLQKITPVPHMPPHIKGVINLRGKVIPILDLRERFGFKDAQNTEHTCIVVVQAPAPDKTVLHCGIIVDEVEEVMTIADASIQPTPEVGGKAKNEYLKGVTTARPRVTTILDLTKLLNEELSLKK